jgi:hypothetical protein
MIRTWDVAHGYGVHEDHRIHLAREIATVLIAEYAG